MLKATEQMSHNHCDAPTFPEEPLLPYHLPHDQTEISASSTSESLEKLSFYWFDQICVHIIYMHIYMHIYRQNFSLLSIDNLEHPPGGHTHIGEYQK